MKVKEIPPFVTEIAEKWHVRFSITPKDPGGADALFELSVLSGVALTLDEQKYFEDKGFVLLDTEDVNDMFKYYFSQPLEML